MGGDWDMVMREPSRISGELNGLGRSAKEADRRGGCIDGGALRFGACFLLLFVSRYVRIADGGGGSL